MPKIHPEMDLETSTGTGNNFHRNARIGAAINAVIRSLKNSKEKNHSEADAHSAADDGSVNTDIHTDIDTILGAYIDHDAYVKPGDIINYLMSENLSDKIRCHHCNSNDVVLFGKGRGKQRYMCKKCGKTFTALTNTPLSGTHHPEKWGHFMECMLKSMTLQEAAKEVEVSYVTLFYWRHKILSILKDIKPKSMKGIVELDDIYINFSKKGQSSSFSIKDFFKNQDRIHRTCDHTYDFDGDKVCVVAASDRYSNVYSCIACIGYPRGQDIEEAIGTLIGTENPICFNNKSAYSTFMHRKKLKRSSKGSFSIKTAKLYIRKCIGWMRRFMGVATSYLNNYLGWYKFLKDISFNETLAGIKSLMEVVCFPENQPHRKAVSE